MTDNLLQTKLFIPPLRPFLVPRSRLINQLNQNQHGKLTLISAPAGFGKTTLVVAWLSDSHLPIDDLQFKDTPIGNHKSKIVNQRACWLSLDENDNSVSRFFTHVIAAIRTIEPNFGSSLLGSLQATRLQNETAVTQTLLNELTQLSQPLTLILDDYHAITNTAVHNILATLIDYLPPNIYLVITSREDPPLPLPRWRVRGQLNEIRADDLRFTKDEAADFLRQTMGLQLDEPAITTLESRTEGWAAGLQLAALSLRDQRDAEQRIATFSGNDRHIADYLLTEVLYQQPPEIQHFLLHTAVLERMCASVCDALLNSGDAASHLQSQTVLERLETTNLFLIPLDNQRRWYRYHHLFADLLREKLLRDEGEAVIQQLHQRAATWYESQNLREEAVHHAFQAEDLDYAGRLVAETAVDSLWQQGGASLIQQWTKALPTPILQTYPRAAILAAAAYLIVGDIQMSANYLDMVADQPEVEAEWHLLEAVLMRNRGQVPQALEFAQFALDSLSPDEHNLRTFAQLQLVNNFLQLAELDEAEQVIQSIRRNFDQIDVGSQLQVLRMHGIIAALRANFKQASAIYHEGLNLNTATNQPMIGTLYNGLGFLHFQKHEFELAANYYEQAMYWSQRTGITDILLDAHLGQAELACWHGDGQQALDIMTQFQQFAQRSQMSEIIEISEVLNALFHLKAGQLETAVQWANNSGLTMHDKPTFHLHNQYKLFIAIHISHGHHTGDKHQLSPLTQLAQQLLTLLRQHDYNFDAIELLTWMTLLYEQQGDLDTALECLQTAVNLAQPSHIIHPFVERGPAIQTLLAQLPPTHPHYLQRLQNAFTPSLSATSHSPSPDALTDREQEILTCLAAGLSNKAIEEKLFISKNTVRTHLKNLYSKLGVNSRTQAIARARDLNLL